MLTLSFVKQSSIIILNIYITVVKLLNFLNKDYRLNYFADTELNVYLFTESKILVDAAQFTNKDYSGHLQPKPIRLLEFYQQVNK